MTNGPHMPSEGGTARVATLTCTQVSPSGNNYYPARACMVKLNGKGYVNATR